MPNTSVESTLISRSVHFRRTQGRTLRQQIYPEILGAAGEAPVSATDLGELSSLATQGVLDGKIAYIFVDGNGFGATRAQLCQTEEDLHDFTTTVQDNCREVFLQALLTCIAEDDEFHFVNADGVVVQRLELLLWGGDEFILVVPAWRAFQTVQLFYEHTGQLSFKGQPLTHRMAIVFAHHNTPILQIRAIAKDLLDQTKDDIGVRLKAMPEPDPDLRYANGIRYLSLKSFDMVRGELGPFLQSYYGMADTSSLLIHACDLAETLDELCWLREHVPRSKALALVYALRDADSARFAALGADLVRLAPGPAGSRLRSLFDEGIDGSSRSRWVWLTDLWDFLPAWSS